LAGGYEHAAEGFRHFGRARIERVGDFLGLQIAQLDDAAESLVILVEQLARLDQLGVTQWIVDDLGGLLKRGEEVLLILVVGGERGGSSRDEVSFTSLLKVSMETSSWAARLVSTVLEE